MPRGVNLKVRVRVRVRGFQNVVHAILENRETIALRGVGCSVGTGGTGWLGTVSIVISAERSLFHLPTPSDPASGFWLLPSSRTCSRASWRSATCEMPRFWIPGV